MSRTPSPSSSPPRKRQRRLSSPTYDHQFPDLSQQDIAAFDTIHSLSQQAPNLKPSRVSSSLQDDPDNPFKHASVLPTGPAPSFSSASAMLGFKLASSISTDNVHLHQHERSPSPEAPPEIDYSTWFEPVQSDTPVSFLSAKLISTPSVPTETPPISLGFSKASGTGAFIPSTAALEKARQEISKIWNDTESTTPQVENKPPESPFPSFAKASTSFSAPRPALRSMGNSINTPATPSPSGFIRPTILGNPTPPSVDKATRTRPKPFKSPLLRNRPASSTAYTASPLNPGRPPGLSTPVGGRSIPSFTPSSALAKRPTASTNDGFTTPLRASQISRPSRPAPFVTPFKPGMKLGDPCRKQLEQSQSSTGRKLVSMRNVAETPSSIVKPAIRAFFDLSPRTDRLKLDSCGTLPQQYDVKELESMGLNYEELSQITPTTALYYCFHTASCLPPSSTLPASNRLGPFNALQILLDRGCMLATQEWVDNHWLLILWKLAGLAAFEPQRERDPETKRWCWQEVIRQLVYRYERELNRGKRPPLRLVVTQDSPASLPMVLCISDIKWFPKTTDEQGRTVESYPELEVTDGWYRLRAQIDASLVRAVRSGKLRRGRKIGVVGARLSSEKKDPVEILEGYNSNKLVLSGNSCSLAPWHAKLGFSRDNFVKTLHSLSSDGGFVCALDFVVVKTHPIAFIEFLEDEDGNKYQEGPRNEAEEREINEKWKRKREQEAAKLRSNFDKKQFRYEGYIDRLERKAGASFHPNDDDSAPENLDNMYDELEDPAEASATIARLSPNYAGWFALHIRRRLEADRERVAEEIEKELERTCPPRNVRSFRVLVAEDAKTMRRSSHRNAQLTVWDVLQWSLSEDQPAGTFEVGHRYLVTKLNPTHHKAWMGRYEDNAEIYLSTGRNSRWIKRTCTM
ncbi:hypothetical protein BDQ17DRAFT_1341502 [Cyathus striatus]|nr:hypothetical protein BDQ17DRAFT_1341502 [Cyathus striatus]